MDGLKNLKLKKVFVFPFSKTSRYVLFYSTAAEIWKHANAGSVTHLLTLVTNVCIHVIYTSVGQVKALVPQVTVTVPTLLKLVKPFSVRAVRTSTEKYSTPWIIGQYSGANSTGRAVAQLVETLRYKPERSRVIGIFHWQNTYGRTTALWSTQPLNRIELSKDNGGRCVGLTNSPPTCDGHLAIWETQTPGTLRACTGIAFYCTGRVDQTTLINYSSVGHFYQITP